MSGEKLLPVFFVDEVKIGETFDKHDWPLHITLFPPVEAEYSMELGIRMREYINPLEPFTVRVNGEAVYGPQEAIDAGNGTPVYTVEKKRQLVAVHKGFIHALSHLPYDRRFMKKYKPHVSKQHARRALKIGEQLHVEGLSVVTREADSSQWTVVDKMRFKATGAHL